MPKKHQPGCRCCGSAHKCCQACQNQTPKVWRVTIGDEEYVLHQSLVSIENEARCLWEGRWSTPITIGECSVVSLWFSFDAQTQPHDPPYIGRFVAFDATNTEVAEWRTDALDTFNCLGPLTLAQYFSECGELADVTLTPSEWKTCCCPTVCQGGTPHQFLVSSIDNSSDWGIAPITLNLDWDACDRGVAGQWYAQFPDAEFEGITANRALLQVVQVPPGVGWRFTLYDVADPTNGLTWESTSPINGILPVDCEDVTTMRLPPTSSGSGPSTSDVALSPINIKTCNEGGSGCDVNCCDAAYFSVLRGVGTLTDGQGWTYTTGSGYVLLPNDDYDETEGSCSFSHFGSWTKTGESPVAGEMRLELARVVVYWIQDGIFQGACLVTRPVRIRWMFGTEGDEADMWHRRTLNNQTCDGDEDGTPTAPGTTCCDGTLTGAYQSTEFPPSPAISSLQYSAVF